jgi:hypothetical protein
MAIGKVVFLFFMWVFVICEDRKAGIRLLLNT